MDVEEITAKLASDDDRQDILQEADDFRRGGVTGVPTFIVNEQAGFAGALPPDQLLDTIKKLVTETDVSMVNGF